jgi:hypothetical protein
MTALQEILQWFVPREDRLHKTSKTPSLDAALRPVV